MTPRKLIFLDIDGTLTDYFNHVPASALNACRAVRKNGHLLYIATGRSRAHTSESILATGFDGIICSGGAYIEIDGQVVFSAFLPRITLERLIAYFNERNASYSLELPEKIIASPQFYSFAPRALLRFLRAGYAPMGEDFDRERVCKLVFMESKQVRFEDVQKEFGADCELFRNSIPIPGMSGGEVSAKGVHKGSAAAWVARYYGMDRADTVAFGDSDNDRAMLEYAGVGVAMGNGDEALKQAADDVAGHVRRGGLAKALKKYGLV
ncbi:MAG: Cof-type HAD-IIB family hydrolase [Treponema sp.]|jgi:Cof subfamily protein (haloacid dehalogenase superfamily)|nr:Cof-type HAD-IIB family hydrolase [Treponema sp.]